MNDDPSPMMHLTARRFRNQSGESSTSWGVLTAFLCLWVLLAGMGARSVAASSGAILLPIEVLGADGTVATRSFDLLADQVGAIRSLWLQLNGVKYKGQASVQINGSSWIPIDNDTATVAEPGKSFGGIGGGFSTLEMTLQIPEGAANAGANVIRFRFDKTDGFSSGFRVLAWNFLNAEGQTLLSPDFFAADAPESRKLTLPDTAAVEAGRELWHNSSLIASSLPSAPRIRAHCADCHAQDGRDLKYFNFSDNSIITRSMFHGLSELQGEQIASYIRSLSVPNPGRPWNPPYQPGPGLDEQPVSNWAAGAGLRWVLSDDAEALPYLFNEHPSAEDLVPASQQRTMDLSRLLAKITPDAFRPDGNLDPRDIPIALQLPDWSDWLPRIHPKDAWGAAFDRSDFAALYDRGAGKKTSLRALAATLSAPNSSPPSLGPAFAEWSQARAAFLHATVKSKIDNPELTNKIYSTQLWQLVKAWEMMQEFSLEGRAPEIIGSTADSRGWFNTTPKETAPFETHIPNGPAGVVGSALTNEYFNAAWYELQILLNSGGHQRRDRAPIDWVYLIGRFRDLYGETHRAEPTQLLIAVAKAWQSSDPRVGPEDYSRGWRPEQNIDPRIMIDPDWAPIFEPLDPAVRRALTNALLAAWMDKNQQYALTKFLPVSGRQTQSYAADYAYHGITGGNVWEAAQKFRDAGVSPDLVERLVRWGAAYNDRAARLQYH
jgi:hypothetical protein